MQPILPQTPDNTRDLLSDALRLIAGPACTHTHPGTHDHHNESQTCRNNPSRWRGAFYGADRWCDACVAFHALVAADRARPGGDA